MKGCSFLLCQFAFVLGLAALKFSFCAGDLQSDNIEALAQKIGEKIHNFTVQATGSAVVEEALKDLLFTTRQNNGKSLVKDVSEKMKDFFNKKIDSLRKLADKAEEVHKKYNYDENIEPFDYLDTKDKESLAKHNLSYDAVFKMNVSYKLSGIHVPTDIYEEDPEILNTIKWTEALDEVFINNTEDDQHLKWQYFGSETGVFRSYPGAKFHLGPKGIDLFDVRKRPWYIHGSTSPKSVVIIVDSSGSMYGRPLLIARLAVAELIDTLSENDFFNLIWFNIDVHYLSCQKKFVQATSQNKEYYKNKLRDIQASYVASWSKAYEAAFQLFKEDVGANCQKAIMVFTDGPTERSEDVFETHNSKKEVRLFTYAVGPPAHSIEALKSIACQNRGYFYRIPGVGSVRDAVKGYVSVLSRPMAQKDKHDPIWSSVYVDSAFLGMVITGTLPAFVQKNQSGVAEILGVIGTDVTLNDIDRLANLTTLGDDGYLFLINNNGHVIKHPAFETHRGYLPDPPDVYISDIEYSWDVNSTLPLKLREKMLETKEEEVGTMTFDVALFSKDELKLRVKKRTMNYYFTKVEGTPIWVGIAIPSTADEVVIDNATATEDVVNVLFGYWKNNGDTGDDVETFVQTYDDSFNISNPASKFKPEEGILGRVDNYPNDVTVLTVPYNAGKENAKDFTITGYRKMTTGSSGPGTAVLDIGVVGFNMNHSKFQHKYLFNTSIQGIGQFCNATDDEDGYYCYLLDENAFIIAASVNSEKVTGQFFGNVNGEVMEQLTTGGSAMIYEQIVRHNPQGSCVDTSASTSSAPFLQPFLSGTSYIKWCFAKAVWFVANLNIYNWLYGKSMSVSAETKEIEKQSNRSCIIEFTAYYSEVNNMNTTKRGEANCESCHINSCPRSFAVSKVPKTNLYLLVVNGHCTSGFGSFNAGIPGVPQEVERSEAEQEEAVCSKDPYRKNISRCHTSDKPENNYPCGRSSMVSISIIFFISSVFTSLCNLADW